MKHWLLTYTADRSLSTDAATSTCGNSITESVIGLFQVDELL